MRQIGETAPEYPQHPCDAGEGGRDALDQRLPLLYDQRQRIAEGRYAEAAGADEGVSGDAGEEMRGSQPREEPGGASRGRRGSAQQHVVRPRAAAGELLEVRPEALLLPQPLRPDVEEPGAERHVAVERREQ